MTIDEANTALPTARNHEQRFAALRALAQAAQGEIERLLPSSPDWTCYHCRQTWAGGTAPTSLICPDCGEPLTEDTP